MYIDFRLMQSDIFDNKVSVVISNNRMASVLELLYEWRIKTAKIMGGCFVGQILMVKM